jgi:hypothetical protein
VTIVKGLIGNASPLVSTFESDVFLKVLQLIIVPPLWIISYHYDMIPEKINITYSTHLINEIHGVNSANFLCK